MMKGADGDSLARLRRAQGLVLGCLDRARLDAHDRLATQLRDAEEQGNLAAATARTISAQRLTQLETSIRDCVAGISASVPSPQLALGDYVTLGQLEMDGVDLGVNHTVTLPALLPLLGRGHVVVRMPQADAISLAQEIICQALEKTAPGQVKVLCFDPLMSGVMSPFASLKALGDTVSTISTEAELVDRLDVLKQDVERVGDVLAGRPTSLLDLRFQEQRQIEQFSLLVLASPVGELEESTLASLTKLASVGPRVGLSQLWLLQPEAVVPDWWDMGKIEDAGHTVIWDEDGPRWEAQPAYRLRPLPHDPTALSARVGSILSAAKDGSGSVLDFFAIQPDEAQWGRSSANGITFNIGMSGAETVAISLGDAREQKHNLLITGAAGNGKSNLLKTIVFGLCLHYAPQELELVMLDFKDGVTLYPMSPRPTAPDFLPHARVLGLESDQDFGAAVLAWVEREISRRMHLIRPHGEDIGQFRAASPTTQMPRMVVAIDEFHALLAESEHGVGDAVAASLERIAKQGRAAGVHLILASQTVSGITSLLARENGIYAQFPLRLALKNSPSESQAALSQGNTAAALLPGRGVAVLNPDYGATEANSRVVVSYLPPEDAARLQRQWWEAARATVHPPVVVDGAKPARVGDHLTSMLALRRKSGAGGTAPKALLGTPLSVTRTPFSVPLSSDPGRHVALLGAGEEDTDGRSPDAAEPMHSGVGMLHAAAVSLALQDAAGEAEFIAVDLLEPQVADRNNQALWSGLMERLGFPLRAVGREELPALLTELGAGLEHRSPTLRTYVIAFNFDRATNLDQPDPFGNTALDTFRDLLRRGPVHGVHFLGWWANPATYAAHLGFGGEGYVDVHGMLRLNQDAVQDILGPFVHWSVRSNRALLADRTQSTPTTVIPFAPLSPVDVRRITAMDWSDSA